jgi:FkbM family methyltransferase
MKPLRLSLAQGVCRNLPPIIGQRFRNLIYPFDRARADNCKFVVRAQTGSMFTSRTSDMHGYPFSVHGYYFWRSWAIALAVCSPGDAIIEVGANIGTETVGFADIVGKGGKVYAFEPLPTNITNLRDNLELNRHNCIEIFPCAVAEECKKGLFVSPPESSSGVGHLYNMGGKETGARISIECVSLNSLMDSLRVAKIIFIDAEGAEVMILRGGENYIRKYRPVIVLEAAPKCLERSGTSLKELRAEIDKLEYKPFKIGRLGLSNVEAVPISANHNWVCFHSTATDIVRVVNKYIFACGVLPCVQGINPMAMRAKD